jgi:hypothetical protein
MDVNLEEIILSEVSQVQKKKSKEIKYIEMQNGMVAIRGKEGEQKEIKRSKSTNGDMRGKSTDLLYNTRTVANKTALYTENLLREYILGVSPKCTPMCIHTHTHTHKVNCGR